MREGVPFARRLLAVAAGLAAACATPAAAHEGSGLVTHRDMRAELVQGSIAATAAAADAPGALPYAWCGDALTRDGTGNATRPPRSPAFKLVYAHPADRPDRFAGWRDALQANVALIQRFLAAQTGGARAVRFDMGTRCGPQYVDVQVVHLTGPRAAYVDHFGAIAREVDARLGAAAGPRNVVILADTLNGTSADYGLGATLLGYGADRPGAANPHNRGGFASILFTRDDQPPPGATQRGWWPEGMLHEMTHNLGGVQWSAPHSTQPRGLQLWRYGHCWQGADVMCYVEDVGAASAMRYDCPRAGGAISQAYDCGRDDYFNPAPAPGSYLTTHWNVYQSAFLAPCAAVAPACGGGLDGLAPAPPVSTGAPAVAGSARRGGVLAASPGAWQNGPLAYAYSWQRERAGAWTDIAGATGAAYQPAGADTGRHLRVQVLATNPDGSAVAASAPTAQVADAGVGRSSQASRRACRRVKARARRPAARCRGRRAPERASAPRRSRPRRTSGGARATPPDRPRRSAR